MALYFVLFDPWVREIRELYITYLFTGKMCIISEQNNTDHCFNKKEPYYLSGTPEQGGSKGSCPPLPFTSRGKGGKDAQTF